MALGRIALGRRNIYPNAKGPKRDILREIAEAPNPDDQPYNKFYNRQNSDMVFPLPTWYRARKSAHMIEGTAVPLYISEVLDFYTDWYEEASRRLVDLIHTHLSDIGGHLNGTYLSNADWNLYLRDMAYTMDPDQSNWKRHNPRTYCNKLLDALRGEVPIAELALIKIQMDGACQKIEDCRKVYLMIIDIAKFWALHDRKAAHLVKDELDDLFAMRQMDVTALCLCIRRSGAFASYAQLNDFLDLEDFYSRVVKLQNSNENLVQVGPMMNAAEMSKHSELTALTDKANAAIKIQQKSMIYDTRAPNQPSSTIDLTTTPEHMRYNDNVGVFASSLAEGDQVLTAGWEQPSTDEEAQMLSRLGFGGLKDIVYSDEDKIMLGKIYEKFSTTKKVGARGSILGDSDISPAEGKEISDEFAAGFAEYFTATTGFQLPSDPTGELAKHHSDNLTRIEEHNHGEVLSDYVELMHADIGKDLKSMSIAKRGKFVSDLFAEIREKVGGDFNMSDDEFTPEKFEMLKSICNERLGFLPDDWENLLKMIDSKPTQIFLQEKLNKPNLLFKNNEINDVRKELLGDAALELPSYEPLYGLDDTIEPGMMPFSEYFRQRKLIRTAKNINNRFGELMEDSFFQEADSISFEKAMRMGQKDHWDLEPVQNPAQKLMRDEKFASHEEEAAMKDLINSPSADDARAKSQQILALLESGTSLENNSDSLRYKYKKSEASDTNMNNLKFQTKRKPDGDEAARLEKFLATKMPGGDDSSGSKFTKDEAIAKVASTNKSNTQEEDQIDDDEFQYTENLFSINKEEILQYEILPGAKEAWNMPEYREPDQEDIEYVNPERNLGFYVRDSIKEEIFKRFHEDPTKNDVWTLAKEFNLRADRIDAILCMKHIEKTEYAELEPFEIIQLPDGTRYGFDYQKFMEWMYAPDEEKVDPVGVDHFGKPSEYVKYRPTYTIDKEYVPESGHGSRKVIENRPTDQKPNRHVLNIVDLSEARQTGTVENRIRELDGTLRYPDNTEWKATIKTMRPLPRKVRERIINAKKAKGTLREEVAEKKHLGRIRNYEDEWNR